MKKFNFLFIALTLVLTACSSDDNDNSNDPGDVNGELIGIWDAVDVLYSGDTVIEVAGQTIVTDFVGESYDVDFTLEFSENPNEFVSEGQYSVELTSTTLGQEQVFDVPNLEFVGDGTWTRDGSQLTTVSNGDEGTMTILELTNTTLRLRYQTVEVINNQGTLNTTTIDLETIYSRM
ncbi:lipocalin family protein [Psychroserpens jangbogonensis]|uniref:lipocalin family protein n=1 Tax=Psychroserpens jangbogonensis TaxID=1484460 RepID=UPI00053CFFE7|nr:lipocalin family protein [Psychroserpens jangbogonensis]